MKLDIEYPRLVSLANCYINMYLFNSTYSEETKKAVEKYRPKILSNKLIVPDYYENLIKNKITIHISNIKMNEMNKMNKIIKK